MSLVGMDTTAVRELARRIQQEGEALRSRTSVIARLVDDAQRVWRGPDSQQLRAEWSARLRPQATQAAEALRTFADAARRNADEQDRASAGDGGASTGSGSGGPGAPAGPPGEVRDKQNESGGKLVRMDSVPSPDEERRQLSPGEITQKGIGDCWLMSAMIAISAKDPNFLADHVRVDNPDNPKEYIVTLYKERTEYRLAGMAFALPVTVYDPVEVRVPVDQARFEKGATDRSGQPSMASVYEAAVAQFRNDNKPGTPSDIWGGWGYESMPMLTGKPPIKGEDPSFDDMQSKMDNGYIYTASSNTQNWADGAGKDLPTDPKLVDNHEYAVEKIAIDPKDGQRKIYLHNPWQSDREPLALTEKQFHDHFRQTSAVQMTSEK